MNKRRSNVMIGFINDVLNLLMDGPLPVMPDDLMHAINK